MSDIDIPLDEEPAEEPVGGQEAEPAPEEATPTETPETPVGAPQGGRWLVLSRISYVDAGGDEQFCGPGEVIDDQAAGQVPAESIEPYAG